ncbi:MAG TPA: hypothetical protein VK154_02545 [Chitinophagales bacterium]|nr:hypothetical protein [Chitinophagales bacterium]
MPKDASLLAKEFIAHLKNIEHTRAKMEELFSQRKIVKRDIELVYSGLFLDAVTSFERFIESLFVQLLCNKATHQSRKIKGTLTFTSEKQCRTIINAGEKYVDWLPIEKTLNRANIFFDDGEPFVRVEIHATKQKLLKLSSIRNAIAHRSSYSLAKFQKHVIAGQALTSSEKTPLGYLRSVYITYPVTERRYQEIIADMAFVANTLVKRTV